MAMFVDSLRGQALQRLLAVICAVAFLEQGYDQGVMNGFLTLDSFLETLPQLNTLTTKGAQQAHNANIQGITVAIYEVGCGFGALSSFFINDVLGRPRSIFLSSCVVIVGVVIQASTYSLGQMIAGRVITGLGVGLWTATIPMYISETADAKHRGPLVLVEGIFALSGIVLASWINFGFYYVKGAVNWRFPIAFQLVFAAFMLVVSPFLPESPRWLIKKDRMEEATAIIARLTGAQVDDFEVSRDAAIIRAGIIADQPSQGVSSSVFAMNKNRHFHRSVLAITTTLITQMTGINIIPFYSNVILQSTLGYSGSVSRIMSGCLQIMLVFGAIVGCLLVERVGRRKLMLGSTAAMVLCQAAVAGLSSDLKNQISAKFALFFYFLALFTLPIGMFMIPFMYASEIAPVAMRQKYAGMAAASSWFFNFLVAEITPVGIASIAWRYYLIYAACSAAGFVVIYLFYPETKGRSLEQIDVCFRRSKTVFDTVKLAREPPEDLQAFDLDQKDEGHVQENEMS